MPKPSRRERRKQAEKGKSVERSTAHIPAAFANPIEAPASSSPAARARKSRSEQEEHGLSIAQQYAHVGTDLKRTAVLVFLIAVAMGVLKFMVP